MTNRVGLSAAPRDNIPRRRGAISATRAGRSVTFFAGAKNRVLAILTKPLFGKANQIDHPPIGFLSRFPEAKDAMLKQDQPFNIRVFSLNFRAGFGKAQTQA